MASYVTSIEAVGIYGRFDLRQEFLPGVNILHGINGAGKTTFLHILSNVLNADYKRFAYLKFKSINVQLDDGVIIEIHRRPEDRDALIEVIINNERLASFLASEVRQPKRSMRYREVGGQKALFEETQEEFNFDPILPADYFPAFRTMIEAWASVQDESDPVRRHEMNEHRRRVKANHLARDLFGNFVPTVNFPSPIEIEQRLSSEIQTAIFTVAHSDQELLSRAFLDIFASLSEQTPNDIQEPPDLILEHINSLYESLEESPLYATPLASTSDVYTNLRKLFYSFRIHERESNTAVRILDVYRNSLVERIRVLKESFAVINTYLNAVNEFFEGKKIEIAFHKEPRYRVPTVGIRFDDDFSIGLRTLSSGERQIVTLIYAATHMNQQRVVLIDEPELSLHVDWQRMLINKMGEQLEGRQVIACTHSPVIAADYEDRMRELVLIHSKSAQVNSTMDDLHSTN